MGSAESIESLWSGASWKREFSGTFPKKKIVGIKTAFVEDHHQGICVGNEASVVFVFISGDQTGGRSENR